MGMFASPVGGGEIGIAMFNGDEERDEEITGRGCIMETLCAYAKSENSLGEGIPTGRLGLDGYDGLYG